MSVEKAVKFTLDGRELLLLLLSETGRGLGLRGFPFVDLPQHLIGPGVGQGNFLNGLTKLSGQGFFADISLSTFPPFLSTPIIVVSLLPLSGDGTATLPASQQPEEWKEIPMLRMITATFREHFLGPFKKFPGNDGRMTPFVQLPLIPKHPQVELTGDDIRQLAQADGLPLSAHQAPGGGKVAELRETVFTCGIGLKQLLDKRGLHFIHHNGAESGLVQIANGGFARKFAPAELLPDAPLDVLDQIVHVIFGLPKRNIEHELPLRRILKPKGRKLERGEFARIEQIDHPAAIHGVSGQPVRMPGENP